MNLPETLDNLELAPGITESLGVLHLVWQKNVAGFDIFLFHNQERRVVQIRDDADYLVLFSQIAERLYGDPTLRTATFLCACSLGGEKMLIKHYPPEEKQQFQYGSVALSNALQQLPVSDRPSFINFYGELSYEAGNTPQFEREAARTARLLRDVNRERWLVIAEQKYDFIKTDLYVFTLQRLHSWGFQAVKPGGIIEPGYNLVRPHKPKPRGAARESRYKKKAHTGAQKIT